MMNEMQMLAVSCEVYDVTSLCDLSGSARGQSRDDVREQAKHAAPPQLMSGAVDAAEEMLDCSTGVSGK